jgi:hypothetical protein
MRHFQVISVVAVLVVISFQVRGIKSHATNENFVSLQSHAAGNADLLHTKADSPLAFENRPSTHKHTRNAETVDSLNSDSSYSEPNFAQRAYCTIRNAGIAVPLGRDLKVVGFNYGDTQRGNAGFVAYILSRECPEGGFSKIVMGQRGAIEEVLDCRFFPKDEIMLKSGVQGRIDSIPSTTTAMNLAISGDGYFLTECSGRLVLQRSGVFQLRNKRLVSGQCDVLDQEWRPFIFQSELDEYGCDSDGRCLAIVRPNPERDTPIGRTQILVQSAEVNLVLGALIFKDAVEDFIDPEAGPMGPNWDNIPKFNPIDNCGG